MTTTDAAGFTYHDIFDAQPGDQVFWASQWVTIAQVNIVRPTTRPLFRDDTVGLVFERGGSHAAPAHHFGQVRRPGPRDFECCTTDEHGIVTSDGPDAPAGHFMAAHSFNGDRPWTLMHDPNTGHYSYGIEDGYR